MSNYDLAFNVPPGIGDISWCYGKLRDLIQTKKVGFRICKDQPQRSLYFLDLLPGVVNLGFGHFYAHIKTRLIPFDRDLRTLVRGDYNVSINPHLEAGQRIEKAYPHQTTHFHYPLNIEQRHRDAAAHYLNKANGSHKIGVYCSSYKHRPDLGFWNPTEWFNFLKMVLQLFPNASLLFVGAPYDDKTKHVYDLCVQHHLNAHSAIAETDIGTTIAILQGLDYFFAFPSGLGVICDVIQKPCTMWYWSNIQPQFQRFPSSYADPVNLENGRHLILPYTDPNFAFRLFSDRGAKWLVK